MNQDELHNKIVRLRKLIEQKKLLFRGPDDTIIKSLSKVKLDKNGKVDPKTVDGTVLALLKTIDIAENDEKIL
ncbi:hypothetical protein [Caenibacillus caldisaponilyticus]|uniref:hypothetical protein n=1 Tax=Caenibacillus caldisaponilyticus TaxID=1674942 RepID=UPI0009883E60|nr:hypothetical protein [Caenibacillus caldisaponilyticus]